MPTDAKLVRGHFLAAAELDAAQRADYLSAHCGDDAAMRAAVERLLAAHDQPARILDQPMVPGPEHTGTYIPPEQPGTLIAGRYKLLEEIGEGGMGTVWVAEQTQPVRRKVALKLIKTGMDSKSVLARFEAERQALAVMDHPNIAKVLDGGLTETGRPFFVMEYVKGVPITQYCDAVRLSIPERLNLFVQVCQAVQHAHQKGIIHRDLKPSNILVAPYDDKPVPKVIDFGLAKAMHQSLTELTLHTAHESVMGTPLYMSPEQAQLNNLDVDTRSDIYSLGVLLYELLTGTTPLEKQRFKQAAWEEMRRLIREEEPPRPSARLSSAQTLPSLAASRHMEPAKLTKLVRGELDWIVMKSLEKDRTRRYETANGFAMDIQRYLAGEPVLAAPPSASYRLRKFARKHRTALTTAAALVLLLVAGVAVSTWQAVRATRAEAAARQAEQDATDRAEGEHLAKLDAQAKQGEAERQKGLADKARQAEADRAEGERLAKLDAQAKQAEAERQESLAKKAREAEAERAEGERAARVNEARERGYAEAITKFVKDDFLALTTVEGQGRFDGEELPPNATLRQLLDRAAEKLKGRKGLAPRTEAELCWIIGVSYRAEEEPALAIPFLERSLELERQVSGLKAVSTLNAQNSLGVAYHRAGQYDRAVPLLEETLKLWQEKFGREHFFTLSSMGNLAEAYLEAGKWDLAMPLLEETLKLRKANGPEQPTTLVSMNVLTTAYLRAGNLDLGRPLAEEALKLTKAKLGPAHPTTLNSMHNRSRAYMEAGKLDLALPLFEETLKLRKANLPPQHPHTLITMGSLGIAYLDTGRLDLAVPLFEDTLKISRAKLGPDHPDTLNFMVCLASGYWEAGKLDLALTLAEETLKLTKIKLGPDHPQTLASMKNLSVLYTHAGKLDVALPLSKETLKLMKAKLGPDHPQTLMSMRNLAIAYQYAGNMDMALPLIEETLKLTKMKLGPDHPQTLAAMDVLASTNQAAGKLDLAVPLFQETLKLRTAKLGPEHPDTLKSMSGLAVAYWQKKQLDKSIPLFEEAVKRQEATLGRNHPGTLANVGNLGVNYKDAGRLKEAIPLLEEAHQAAKQYPALRWVGTQLLDAYAKAGENVKFSNLLQEQLAETRGMPKESAQLANMLAQIGLAYQNAGKLDLALPLLEEALKISKANVGPDHSNTLTIMNDLAAAYWQSKQLDKSIPLFQEALKGREAKLGRDHSATLTTVGNLGVNYKDAGRLKEAIPLLEEAHQAAKKYPALRWVGTQLLDAYAKAGENVKLANLLQEQLAEARQALPKDSPQLAGQLAQIGLVHLQQKQWAEAEPLLRECLDIRAKSQPGVWSTFNTKSMLGGALLGQKKYADAEPLLLAGYEGMKKQEAKIPPQGKVRLTEAVEWLVQLYEATDNPDEAARWREERDAIQAAQKKTQKQR